MVRLVNIGSVSGTVIGIHIAWIAFAKIKNGFEQIRQVLIVLQEIWEKGLDR